MRRYRLLRNNDRGVILITVLWIILILGLIAWGLGQRSSLQISLLETYQGKVRSYAAARGGLNYVMHLLAKKPAVRDTLYSCGLELDKDQSPQEVFERIEVGPGTYASVQWVPKGYSEVGNGKPVFGARDEQGKININNIDQNNYTILSLLFERRGLTRSAADALARGIMAYRASGETPEGEKRFLDDSDDVAVKPKRKPYDNLYELLNVTGMTKDFFDTVRDDLTVYGDPAQGLVVNVRTANNAIIQTLVDAAAQTNPTVNTSEILRRAYAMRDGNDGASFTEDDGRELEAGDRNVVDLAGWPAALQDTNTSFIRLHVIGVDEATKARTELDVVVRKSGGFTPNEIIGWQRD